MIKTNVEIIINSISVFNRLLKEKFNAPVAFKISSLAQEIQKQLEKYIEERDLILKSYGVTEDNIKSAKLNQDFYDKCEKLLKEEVILESVPFKLSDLKEIKFSPNEMTILNDFIEIDM